ncbi:ATP-dependent nuclease [Candidatus Enterococcus courvalinii]|uniref:AAA family ATPase n=1 Tax=Candidatus Enterococcus courvalinii TaxID=2815329 RepID=A0ABS3HWZ9_9ENTE|nr:AAA family ATPase [Enterococcus sp. MSG2901]MBO0480998.1 AAA family ATPase [Enterococcus sp. MSG2901]
MYISSISLKNFRIFGDQKTKINFNKGLTLLVGENDSGKSAVIDAFKIVLGTTDLNWYRIKDSDFNNEDITKEIEIVCKFSDLTNVECAAFLEYLTYEKSSDTEDIPVLYVNWSCKMLLNLTPFRPITRITTGINSDGPTLSQEAKELLRVTHLRALRDAYSDMQSGRNSRLSQVMQNIPNLNAGRDTYTEDSELNELSLTGIFNLSNQLLSDYVPLKRASQKMSDILDKKMLLKNDDIKVSLNVSGVEKTESKKIVSLLEKLDLTIDKDTSSLKGLPGLGTSNIMSMACELLLKENSQESSQFLLIEEPESHIHAQRQLKLIKSLQNETEQVNQQIILTTHSPLLASVVKLENIIIIKSGTSYPLAKGYTRLDNEDYTFLEKYIDATKANLFFSRSVIVVEGPGEALLLPTLATLLNRDFTDYGVSLVDVRGTGLRRYSKIFQRENENVEPLNIKVACVTDRDVMPNCAPRIVLDKSFLDDGSNWPIKSTRNWTAEREFESKIDKEEHLDKIKQKADGQLVKTFVSNYWTLEYDLLLSSLGSEKLKDIMIDSVIKTSYKPKNHDKKKKELEELLREASSDEEKAAYFYSYFTSGKTSKADFAQQLAVELESNYKVGSTELADSLPSYLKEAIYYVTEKSEVIA